MKGVIALDLDGTVLNASNPIESDVKDYLESLVHKGYCLIFISGRNYKWMVERLGGFTVPYTIAAQNGSFIIGKPSDTIISQLFLTPDLLDEAKKISQEEGLSYVLYGGYAEKDAVIWHPEQFSNEMRDYLTRRYKAFNEDWREGPDFLKFEAIKWIGPFDVIKRICQKVQERLKLSISPIKDPFDQTKYVAQATHPLATKGEALKKFKQVISAKGAVIGAGDDLNDETLLNASDLKVVMESAPEELKKIADVIAPASEKQGIIEGLKIAIAQSRPLSTVGVMIRSPKKRILLVRSPKWHNKWSLPGGKVELGETLEEAARREVKEETNLNLKDVQFAHVVETIFSTEFTKRRHFIMHDFLADLDEGSTEGDVILNEEADAFVWVTREQALKMDLIEPGFKLLKWQENARPNWF